jgi:hypothetical protein
MQQRRSVTMPEGATAAVVSEATDCRFPGQAFAAGQGLSGGLAHPGRGLRYCAFTAWLSMSGTARGWGPDTRAQTSDATGWS